MLVPLVGVPADLVVEPAMVERDEATDPSAPDEQTEAVSGDDPRDVYSPGPQSTPREAALTEARLRRDGGVPFDCHRCGTRRGAHRYVT